MKKTDEKGITLIALIITIIVMLILVGVTISGAINGGLFGWAQNAAVGTNEAIEREQKFGVGEIEKSLYGATDAVVSLTKYKEELLNEDGVLTENAKYISGSKVAVIPKNFVVSEVDGETTIDGGLVIKDSQGNEFVWVTVNNANDMFMCQAKTENTICNLKLDEEGKPYCAVHNETDSTLSKKMAGRLYATTAGESFNPSLTTQTYNANSGLREPAIVTSSDGSNLATINTILGTNYDDSASFLNSLKEEYNNIVASVIKYKGFYVGRYETNGMVSETTAGTIKIQSGKTPSGEVSWYNMYAQQKKYVEGLEHIGGMIQGAAYDQVMKFVNVADFATKTGRVGTSSSPYASGTKTEDISKNICDLRGNVSEWTTEAHDSYDIQFRVVRGSNYYRSGSASNRNNNDPTSRYDREYGSRIALYINPNDL